MRAAVSPADRSYVGGLLLLLLLALLVTGLAVGLGLGYSNQPLPTTPAAPTPTPCPTLTPPPNCSSCLYMPTAIANNVTFAAQSLVNYADEPSYIVGSIALFGQYATLQNLQYDSPYYSYFAPGSPQAVAVRNETLNEFTRLTACNCDVIIYSVPTGQDLVIGPRGIYCLMGEVQISGFLQVGLVVDLADMNETDFVQVRIYGSLMLTETGNTTFTSTDPNPTSHLFWVVMPGGLFSIIDNNPDEFFGIMIGGPNSIIQYNDIEFQVNVYSLAQVIFQWSFGVGLYGCWPAQNATLLPCPDC
jgi:hypothetical protein